ncbi:MAG TPA: hypothetical protein PKG52_03225 [bacterium]|nr:hypothetical protein [bacterium]HPS29631.1 hypothetical protein [bacterium]
MPDETRKVESLDFAGAFEQGWIQYRSNFVKLFLIGIPVSIPIFLFFVNIAAGVLSTIIFQGFLFVVLADVISSTSKGVKIRIFETRTIWEFFKNGLVISLFILPPLVISSILIIPPVYIFSLFMFSFFHVVSKDKLGIEACMESFREGEGYRFYFFLFALILFSSTAVIFIISEMFPPLFILCGALVFPYMFSVMSELYEQLENK